MADTKEETSTDPTQAQKNDNPENEGEDNAQESTDNKVDTANDNDAQNEEAKVDPFAGLNKTQKKKLKKNGLKIIKNMLQK